MTRINSAIPPQNLTDQHLLAELRELPRIFTAVNKRIIERKNFDDIPNKFTLGAGHCKFFYDKLYFLNFRFQDLKIEYLERYGKTYERKLDIDDIRCANTFLFRNHEPTKEEHDLLVDRISTRIRESKQVPRYYGQSITKERAIEILKGSLLDTENVEVLTLESISKEKKIK